MRKETHFQIGEYDSPQVTHGPYPDSYMVLVGGEAFLTGHRDDLHRWGSDLLMKLNEISTEPRPPAPPMPRGMSAWISDARAAALDLDVRFCGFCKDWRIHNEDGRVCGSCGLTAVGTPDNTDPEEHKP